MCVWKQDLALNNPLGLVWHKTPISQLNKLLKSLQIHKKGKKESIAEILVLINAKVTLTNTDLFERFSMEVSVINNQFFFLEALVPSAYFTLEKYSTLKLSLYGVHKRWSLQKKKKVYEIKENKQSSWSKTFLNTECVQKCIETETVWNKAKISNNFEVCPKNYRNWSCIE